MEDFIVEGNYDDGFDDGWNQGIVLLAATDRNGDPVDNSIACCCLTCILFPIILVILGMVLG